MRLEFIYRRLVLSSTNFGKRNNLKLVDSIVTVKTLVGGKYYSPPPPPVLRKRKALYGRIQFLPKLSWLNCNALPTKLSLYRKKKKEDSADQSEIIPFDEYIFFFAHCELSRENKTEQKKPDRKNKRNHQKTVLGESKRFY